MKKIIIIVVIAGILSFIALGLYNIAAGIPIAKSYAAIPVSSPQMKRAKEIIGNKCLMCHSQNPSLPFYAKVPEPSAMIGSHIKAGTEVCDLEKLLAANGKDEIMLAKLEQTINLNTMPILPFLTLHWNGRLTAAEKKDLLSWIHQVRAENYSTGLASSKFANHPIQPLPSEWIEGTDPKKVKLGRLLYHDNRLSGDNTISCANCHELNRGGTDRSQFSTGVRGQLGGINAPTSFNAMFNSHQFWDGRAKDLADQAGGPPLNPIEMDSSWEQITEKLSKDSALTELYKEIYIAEQWNATNITDSIAEFEKTLITPDSGLDRYLKGDEDALTATEKEGFTLFNSHSCNTCHAGKAMGGRSFEKAVNPVAYYKSRNIIPGDAEMGRFNVTKNEEDRYKLKVPLLRNIAITGPYLHDGKINELKEIVTIMNKHFVPKLNRKKLSDSDADKITAMLKKNNGLLFGKQL